MKWYDYLVCIWFAGGIWVNIMILDAFGAILNLIFYFFYEAMRKGQTNGNVY
jgi:hypothetical protein